MPRLMVQAFDGIIPRTSPTRLAINQAQQAQNVKLYSGELRYWQGETLAYTPSLSGIETIYRLYNSSSSIWLTWNTLVDVVPGPIADTSDFRIYYTDGVKPKKTNYALASSSAPFPTAFLNMGVPAPVAAPTVSSASHSSPAEFRTYVYTYLSTFGALTEESAPSPASAIVGVDVPGTTIVTVNAFSAAPTTNYNITGINIYRSVAGATTANYEFVAFIPIATTTYADTLLTAALGQVIPTIGWTTPPDGLTGIVSCGNGFLAGFVGNTVYFSQPNAPHAWPLAYALSFPYNVVGLAVTDGFIVVMTTRYPQLISGVVPGQMTTQQLPNDEPCLARSTITTNENGVLYACPEGLMSIGAGGAAIITDGLYKRTDWEAINPAAMRGLLFDGQYFGIYTGASAALASIVINSQDVPALSTLNLNAAAAYKDSITGNLFVVDATSGDIMQVDADPNNPLNFSWTSRRFVTPQAVALSAMKVDANFDQITEDAIFDALIASIIAANTALFTAGLMGAANVKPVNAFAVNGSTLQPIPVANEVRNLTVEIFGDDGVAITTVNVTGYDPIRLPAFKAREIYFVISGNIYCRSIAFATTMRELDPMSIATSMSNPTLWQ